MKIFTFFFLHIMLFSTVAFTQQLNHEDAIKALKKQQQITQIQLDIQEKKIRLIKVEKNIIDYTNKAQEAKQEALSKSTASYHASSNAATTINDKDAAKAEKAAKQALKKTKQAESFTSDVNDEKNKAEKLKKQITNLEQEVQKLEQKS